MMNELKTLTANQLTRLAALVPVDLAAPDARILTEQAVDWASAPPLERLVLARLFGRATQRQAIRPAIELLHALEVPIRDLAMQVCHDPGIRAFVQRKLGYTNDGRLGRQRLG